MTEPNVLAMYQRWYTHSVDRCMERYGLLLSEEDYYGLIQQIVSGLGEVVKSFKDTTRSIYRVKLHEQNITVIFCAKHCKILSVLHNGWVKKTKSGSQYLQSSASRHFVSHKGKTLKKSLNRKQVSNMCRMNYEQEDYYD